MGLTHTLYRFFKLQRRRIERAFGVEPPPPPPKPRVRKERRKRDSRRSVCNRVFIGTVYIFVAFVAAAHLSGRRPLRLLRRVTTGGTLDLEAAQKDVQAQKGSARRGISGLLGQARLKAIGAGSAASAMALGGVTGKVHHPPERSDDAGPQSPVDIGQRNMKANAEDSQPSTDDAPQLNPSVDSNRKQSSTERISSAGSTTVSAKVGEDVDSVGEEDIASGGGDDTSKTASRPQVDNPSESSLSSSNALSSHQMSPGISSIHGSVRSMEDDMLSRRCFVSGVTEDSLCVHTPFCVRHTGIVYVAETLKCAPYSNAHGIMGTLSTKRCVETERDMEHRADILDPEHKSQVWLNALEKDGKVQWYEGETVFLVLSAKARSVAHYSQRIFFLHHILLHPERYGMGHISNVVIAADEEVAKKIKFRKSWHYGLLAAIVHPSKPLFKHHEVKELVSEGPARPGALRVFVPTGLENLAKGRQVPCFRRAAIPGAVHSQYLLTQDRYPGIVSHGVGADMVDNPAVAAAHKRGKYFDGAMLRKQIYASLDKDEPGIQKKVVYLHRAKGRVLSQTGREKLERALKEVATELGYDYSLVDLAGKSFNEQVEALSGAAIAVGVHGMQLMSTLFMPGDGALIEIFPYKFWHELYSDGCGSGLFYQSLSISKGEDHEDVAKYGGLDACVSSSRECRLWYRSDNRELDLGEDDAIEIQRMVREAANVISRTRA